MLGKSSATRISNPSSRPITFANKAELEKQMPALKKKFLYAEDFAKASLNGLFGEENLKKADILTADYFSNILLVNNGNLQFEIKELPWQAQLTTFRDAAVINANNDELPDLLLTGNYYGNNGRGSFTYQRSNGFSIKGEVRKISKINIGNKEAFVLACNNDSARIIQVTGKK